MTFWKWKNYGDSKKVNGCRGGAKMNRQNTDDFQGSETAWNSAISIQDHHQRNTVWFDYDEHMLL